MCGWKRVMVCDEEKYIYVCVYNVIMELDFENR